MGTLEIILSLASLASIVAVNSNPAISVSKISETSNSQDDATQPPSCKSSSSQIDSFIVTDS